MTPLTGDASVKIAESKGGLIDPELEFEEKLSVA